jgi:glycosyltransferase involved in cell wall biosynthesis
MILISIVTIVYNDLAGLKNTVESIDRICSIKSIYSKIEHIIIDGNSDDGTSDYALSIGNLRKVRTLALSENDEGIYDAMNKGINISCGHGIIFLNAGDLFHPECDFEIIFDDLTESLLKINEAGLVYSSIFKIGNREILIKPRHVSIKSPRMPGSHQAMLYKRTVLLRYPFNNNFKICGDFDNFCQIKNNIGDFRPINRLISIFNAGGISTRRPIQLIFESYSISISRFKLTYLCKFKLIIKLSLSLALLQILWTLSIIFAT